MSTVRTHNCCQRRRELSKMDVVIKGRSGIFVVLGLGIVTGGTGGGGGG